MNGEFWQRMSDFDRLHPEADLCVIHTIKKHLGNYVEHLEFQCCQESEKKQVIEIYNQHYHLYPLSFYTFLEREPTCEELVYLEGKPQ
ncbi:hypothetical protein EZS27_004724 [termite gut metagenome]|uniref:Uncharacterized protein n=1 Tax=termite gut metagenome TaxID=433724 RepID=A0A5J4SNR0_9ZZZZ